MSDGRLKVTADAAILVVEDENIVALDLRRVLTELGYRVVATVGTGEEAIERAEALRPDLVLMDITLRGSLDGIQATERIHQRLDLPIVYLTAYSDEATLARAKVTEPFGYVLKPFDERELHVVIEMTLYRHRMERRLRESERWLSATVRSIGDAVITADAQGRVRTMNPQAEHLTGWTAQAAIGRPLDVVLRMRPDGRRTTESGSAAGRLQRPGSPDLDIEQTTGEIRDEAGNVLGLVTAFRDVSDRIAMERRLQAQYEELATQAEELTAQAEELTAQAEELQQANARLQELDRMKDMFLSVVSHELRTPINAITGFGSILADELAGPLNPQQHDYLRKILGGADTLLSLVNDLLDMSRMEAGKFQLKPVPMQVAEAVSATLETLRPLADLKSHHLIDAVPAGLPAVVADPDRVRQILVNLVNNAIKFTPERGTITVRASQVGGALLVEVEDTGPGITAEDVPKLFERFTQLDNRYTRKAGGTGLGLSIAKALVQAQGGQIGVRSEPGKGSTFWFSLPLR